MKDFGLERCWVLGGIGLQTRKTDQSSREERHQLGSAVGAYIQGFAIFMMGSKGFVTLHRGGIPFRLRTAAVKPKKSGCLLR